MADGSFAAFLSASLRMLETECPDAYRALAQCLAGLRVAIDVGTERVVLAGEAGAIIRVRDGAVIELATERSAILALIDGKDTLVDGILGDRVRLRGAAGELVRTFDALHAYLEGAVRSPSFLELLTEFRAEKPRA